tara:strand:- start:520 stop:774 length:255 start_codon:yes stop_codon:yes gene_type:complete
MKGLKTIVYALATPFSVLLIGCSTTLESGGTRALFETRAEAEKAAKDFNCKGAHQMGDKWMPCYSHDTHEGRDKHEKHGGHHHH